MHQKCGRSVESKNQGEYTAVLVDVDIREQLSYYCMVTKQTQEKAANQALRKLLTEAEQDPIMCQKMQKARQLHEDLKNL